MSEKRNSLIEKSNRLGSSLELKEQESVILEIGCGANPYFLSEAVNKGEVKIGKQDHYIGLDIVSPKLLTETKKAIENRQEIDGKVDFIYGSGDAIPLASRSVDQIVTNNLFSAPFTFFDYAVPGITEYKNTNLFAKIVDDFSSLNGKTTGSVKKRLQKYVTRIAKIWEEKRTQDQIVTEEDLLQNTNNEEEIEYIHAVGSHILYKLDDGLLQLAERKVKARIISEIFRVLKTGCELSIYETRGNYEDGRFWVRLLENDTRFILKLVDENYYNDTTREIRGDRFTFTKRELSDEDAEEAQDKLLEELD